MSAEPRGRPRIPDDELKRDVERVASLVGGRPRIDDYEDHGQYSYVTVVKRFDDEGASWLDALDELGI